MSTCTWTYDQGYDSWNTSCEKTFILIDSTPIDNEMRYCCYCGKRLEERVPVEDREEK